MFDVQRTAIKQGEQALKQGLAAQRQANKLALAGIKGQESFQRQGLELAQAATNAYMGTGMTMMSGRGSTEQRRGVDETFAQLKDMHAQFYDAIERELDRGVKSFEDFSDEYVDSLDQQTDQLLEAHQTIEDQSAQNFDEFSQQLRDQLERAQEMQDELEDQFEQQSEQAEKMLEQQREQAEKFQQQLEEEAKEMQRQIERQGQQGQQAMQRAQSGAQEGQQSEGQSEGASEHQLELIDGLGPTFRERLSEAGISSIDDLAGADPDTIAEAADVSRERAEEWIDQANA